MHHLISSLCHFIKAPRGCLVQISVKFSFFPYTYSNVPSQIWEVEAVCSVCVKKLDGC